MRAENPLQLLHRIRQVGLSSVQLDLSLMITAPQTWGDAITQLRQGGIWVVSGMMTIQGGDASHLETYARPGSLLADHLWYNNRKHADAVARLADQGSIALVSTQIGAVPVDADSPQWSKLVDRMRMIAEMFGHYGIELAVECGQSSAESLNHLLQQLDLPYLGINFDPASVILSGGGDPIASLRMLTPRVRQAHIRDALPGKSPGSRGREVAVGSGAVDWTAFFEVAMAINPPIQFVIERDPRAVKDSDIAAARDLIAYHLAPGRHPASRA